MATFREYLKDHPFLLILGAVASICTIMGWPGNCNKEKNIATTFTTNRDTILVKSDVTDVHSNPDSHPLKNYNRQPITAATGEPTQPIQPHMANTFTGIAVLATENGHFSTILTNKLNGWASQAGPSSQSALQTEIISNGSFDKIIEHNVQTIKAISPFITGHICLLRCNTTYEDSSVDAALYKAITIWDIIVINAQTTEVILREGSTLTASDISKNSAAQRNYDEIFSFLNNKKIDL